MYTYLQSRPSWILYIICSGVVLREVSQGVPQIRFSFPLLSIHLSRLCLLPSSSKQSFLIDTSSRDFFVKQWCQMMHQASQKNQLSSYAIKYCIITSLNPPLNQDPINWFSAVNYVVYSRNLAINI